jgi:methionyl aminopeptidase
MNAITVKTKAQLDIMRQGGKILADLHLLIGDRLKEGLSTLDIDKIAYKFITEKGAEPSFLGYSTAKGMRLTKFDKGVFPASACVSINSELLHGIPRADRIIKHGDLVKIDIGVLYKGFNTDAARTYEIGGPNKYSTLIRCAEEAFREGIKQAGVNKRQGDISAAIQKRIEQDGFGIVTSYQGHGIGHKLHEPPDMPNYGQAGMGIRLQEGMTIAIEPMITAGRHEVEVLKDGWTVAVKDKSMCAHYENTVAVTDNGAEILTV